MKDKDNENENNVSPIRVNKKLITKRVMVDRDNIVNKQQEVNKSERVVTKLDKRQPLRISFVTRTLNITIELVEF